MHGPVPAGLVLVIEIVLSSPTTRAPKPGERSSDPAEHGRLPLLCAVPLSSLPDASTRRPAAHDGLGERRGRSARGPYRIGNLGIRAGRSGHDRYEGTAGPSTFPAYELGRPTSVEAASNPTSGTPTDLLIRAYLPPARERPTGERCEPAPRGRPRSAEPSRTATSQPPAQPDRRLREEAAKAKPRWALHHFGLAPSTHPHRARLQIESSAAAPPNGGLPTRPESSDLTPSGAIQSDAGIRLVSEIRRCGCDSDFTNQQVRARRYRRVRQGMNRQLWGLPAGRRCATTVPCRPTVRARFHPGSMEWRSR
jgi:hypothetical protein